MTASTFVALASQILAGLSESRRRTPAELLAQWRRFVEDCLAGYQWSWYDFDNERRIRGVIQLLIEDPSIQEAPEWAPWAQEVRALDKTYREFGVPLASEADDQPWWLGTAPQSAGPELAADLKAMFGLEVAVRDR